MVQGLELSDANPVHQNGRIQAEILHAARLIIQYPIFWKSCFLRTSRMLVNAGGVCVSIEPSWPGVAKGND
jgi:hypothetical protein